MQSKNTMTPKQAIRPGVTAAVRKARVRKTFNRLHQREEELTAYEQWQKERYGNYLPDGEPPLENYTD